MAGERGRLRLAGQEDPIWRLWRALPEPWQGPIIGPDIPGWASMIDCCDGRRLNLTGIPDVMAAELAWMAHWQAKDGTRVSVAAIGHLAATIRCAAGRGHPLPPSVRQMDFDAAAALQKWYCLTLRGRFPSAPTRAKLNTLFRFAHPALVAACHEGHWWELDQWYPRCDPRIPLGDREPLGHIGSNPGLIGLPWLREAVKWCLGALLDAGTLRWGTVSQGRMASLQRFDRWLTGTFTDPREILGDPGRHRATLRRFGDGTPTRSTGAGPASSARCRRPWISATSTRTCWPSPSCSSSWPPTTTTPALSSGRMPHHGRWSPPPTRPAGHGRSYGYRYEKRCAATGTSMTMPSPRSPRPCHCWACPTPNR